MLQYINYETAFKLSNSDILAHGIDVSSRNGGTRELLGYAFEVLDPKSYKFSNEKLGIINYQYADDMYDWMINGCTEAHTKAFAEKYPKVSGFLQKPKNSNLPANFNAFYGERIARQLPAIKKELQQPNSRRAVINILNEQDQILFDAVEGDITEYPCCQSVTFNIRDGKLYMHVHMRSINMGKVAKLDFYLWGRFHCELAQELNVQPAKAVWTIVSAHMFETDIDYLYKFGTFDESIEALSAYGHRCISNATELVDVHLIRHAKTESNVDRTLQGWSQSSIVGFVKDLNTDEILVNADTVYISTLERAVLTAKAYGFDGIRLDGLREMNWGQLDGRVQITEETQQWIADLWKHPYEAFSTGGETLLKFYKRVINTLKQITAESVENETSKVAIVTHGLVICALFSMLHNVPFSLKFKPDFEEARRLI